MNQWGVVGALLGIVLLLPVAPAVAAADPPDIPPPPPSLLLNDPDLKAIMAALYGSDEEEEVEDSEDIVEDVVVIEPEPEPEVVAPEIPETVPPPIRKKVRPLGPATLHLSAIMYFGPQTWTVWLNGGRITPDMRISGIDIMSVRRDAMQLKVRVFTNRPPLSVELRPNQTFIAATREVIEGAPTYPVAGSTASSP